MGRRDLLAGLTLAACMVLLAGCLSLGDDFTDPTGDTSDPDAWSYEPFIDPFHDHEDPLASGHNYSSSTMEHVAHHQLTEDTAPSYIGELDSEAGMTAVAIVGQGSTPGFVLLDTSDPEDPQKLSRVEAPESYGVDVKLTEDGDYATLATQQIGSPPEGPPPGSEKAIEWGASNGFLVYDISDPTQPELVHFQPVEPLGCHLVTHATVDGTEYVWCVAQSITVFRFERSPQPATVKLGTYWPTDEGSNPLIEDPQMGAGATPHDMTFREDPKDGTPLLSVSHWDLGVSVLDVSNPSAPEELVRWTGEGAEHYTGNVHSAMPALLDETRVLVVTPETTTNVTSPIWILDVDDWDSPPELVSEWVHPQGHTSQGLTMTVHQIQIVDETLYLAYNHNGIWVFDMATMAEHGGNAPGGEEILGVHMPQTDGIPRYDRGGFPMGLPAVWDVNVVDGYILGSDRYTGLHVVHHVDDPKGDSAQTSFA